jgi:serine/threonine protein phosphatase PrpC
VSRAGRVSLGSGARWEIEAAQSIGARSEQQDVHGRGAIRLDDGEVASLAVVADGMGGEAGGRLAAETAVRAFLGACEDGTVSDVAPRLRDALLCANAAVHGCAASDEALAGMGCTLVALALARGRATWISVGDSLLLRLRGREVERLNADHSMGPAFDQAAQAGEMTIEEAASHPNRGVLLSALTGNAVSLIDERSVPLAPGDRFVLASDGLLTLGMADVAAVANAAGEADPTQLAPALTAAVEARQAPGQDNITVVAVAPAQAGRRSPAAGLLLIGAGVILAAMPGALLVRRHLQRPADVATVKPAGEPAAAATRRPIAAGRSAQGRDIGQPASPGVKARPRKPARKPLPVDPERNPSPTEPARPKDPEASRTSSPPPPSAPRVAPLPPPRPPPPGHS